MALLGMVVLLAYPNVILRGESLVATANYSPIDDGLAQLRPGTVRGPAFLNWHDQGGVWWQWEPAAQFFGAAFRRGDVPLWDPLVAGGVDTHVNVTQAQYFPPHVLLLLAGNSPLARDIYYLLLLLTSGSACFVLLRRNGFHRASAAFMGAAWILGGTMTQNVNALLGQTFATLPWMVLSVDWLLDRMTWRAAAVAAMVVGLSTYSSFLPIVISGYVLIGIQVVVYTLSGSPADGGGWRPAAARLGAFAGVVLWALGIAAFLLVPLAVARQGNEFFESWYAGIGRIHYGLTQYPTLLSPRLFHDVNQTHPPQLALLPKRSVFESHFFHVGFVVTLLACLARRDDRPRVRRLTLFFAVSAAFLLAKLVGLPPVQWIAELPVFRLLHFVPYFSGAMALALTGLAACGLEALVRDRISGRRTAIVIGASVALLAAIPAFALLEGVNAHAARAAVTRYALEAARITVVVVLLGWVVVRRWRGRGTGTQAAAAAVALLLVELVPLAFHRRYRRADVWRHPPPYVRIVQSDPGLFRIHSVHDPALPPNTFQGVGLAGIGSLGVFNQPRYGRLIEAYFETERNSSFILPRTLVPEKPVLLDMLNVKYVLTYRPNEQAQARLAAAGFTAAAVDGNFAVYRNPRVWPRAFVAHDYRVVGAEGDAIAAVGDLDSPNVVVVERAPGFARVPRAASDCTIELYAPNHVAVTGETQLPGMLVLLDAFGPGWSASVNGGPTAIVPVNGAFRGLPVPAGRWRVAMTYRPPFLRAGLIASFAALGAALLMALAPWRRRDPEAASGETEAALPAAPDAPRRPADHGEVLQLIYREMYSEADHEEMRQVWGVLVRDFFQRRIREDATVVDVGAGACWFINAVRAARRIAIDANPDTVRRAGPGVEVMSGPQASLANLPDASVDHIFMSNFLEHLPSYREVIDVLALAYVKLRPGGSVLILQPNYRLEPVRYFDPIDHTVVLTDRNLSLVLRALSFRIEELRVRFLPFTGKSRLPKASWLVALYLRVRPVQWLLGGQTFIHARRPAGGEADGAP